jgi:hypothetical protein
MTISLIMADPGFKSHRPCRGLAALANEAGVAGSSRTLRSSWCLHSQASRTSSSPAVHYRAIHSGPGWSPADNDRQRHSDLDLRRFLQSQVTNRADLALQAGGQRGLSRPSNWTVLRAFSRLLSVVLWQIFWQAPLRARSISLFVLVGVTGFEPVASAV